jgi:hypothetical protein
VDTDIPLTCLLAAGCWLLLLLLLQMALIMMTWRCG